MCKGTKAIAIFVSFLMLARQRRTAIHHGARANLRLDRLMGFSYKNRANGSELGGGHLPLGSSPLPDPQSLGSM
jgi:hypothetical protein